MTLPVVPLTDITTSANSAVSEEVIYADKSFWLSLKKLVELFNVSVSIMTALPQFIFKATE